MLDVRKAASRGATVSGTLRPTDLQRFRPLLADDKGVIESQLSFFRDDENRYLIHLVSRAQVNVICQRCLEPMSMTVNCDNTLAVLWTDEEARHLPRHLDPLIAENEDYCLWDMVEEELILALPPFNYHDTDQCNEFLVKMNADQGTTEAVMSRNEPNPFDVLAKLKPGTTN
ncbi:MAG: YceD family protein [Pseudomonadota bacterium]